MKFIFLLLPFIASCQKCPEKAPPFTKQEFAGREEVVLDRVKLRRPVYQAKVPKSWIRIDPEGSIQDTRKPIVTFHIDEQLTLNLHTFPSENLKERIPPSAQIERWKRQLKSEPAQAIVEIVGQGGFTGLFVEAPSLLAWSMQMDMEHYQTLSFLAHSPSEQEHFKQMRADFTIKVTGPEEKIKKHREEICLFANSFELIQEIPKRT